jgi:uncharacterized membrane protein YcaP (DUF421 family)
MESYINIIIRTLIGFFSFFILMRFMGKREVGQLSLFDLIIILSMADLMVLGIDGFEDDIFYSLIPMVIVAIIQIVIALVSLKFAKIRNIVDGKSSYIIINGQVDINEMKKQRYNMDDLYTQLRSEGIKSIQEVEIAVLETSGKLSSFKKKEDIDASLPVIVSGKIDYIILKNLGKNEDWLLKELSKKGYTLNKILGACIINNKLDIVKSINNNGK